MIHQSEQGVFLGRVTFPPSGKLALALYTNGWKCENPGSGLEISDVVAILDAAYPPRHGRESVSGAAAYLEGQAEYAVPTGADQQLQTPQDKDT